MKKDIAASDNFSVALGLFDYVNPLFYAVTCLTVALHTWNVMPLWVYLCYVLGAVVSMVFGLTIPTVKLLVGLGKMRFKMPVNLVFYVNSGILVSCLSLFGTLMRPRWWLRSPGGYQDNAVGVNLVGSVDFRGLPVDTHYVAVRPAMWIDLGS